MSSIRPFTSSPSDITLISQNWSQIFPSWPVSPDRLSKILCFPTGSHVLSPSGFCILYLGENGHAHIAAVGVLPNERRKGLGKALVAEAQRLAREKTPEGVEMSYEIGSSLPRFWHSMLKEASEESMGFFNSLGYTISKEPTIRDYYRDISHSIGTPELLARVSKLPLTFSPWSPEGYEECLTKQRANFSSNQTWVYAYEQIHAMNLHREVMVAFNEAGEQVGWTIMSSPLTLLAEMSAFLPLCPSGERTGMIACVGIDKGARGGRIGQAMLVAAMRDMKERGMTGVYIDGVVIERFYESLGYDVLWEYVKLEKVQ